MTLSPGETPCNRALVLPVADPATVRLDMSWPEGATIAEIVALAMPALPSDVAERTRVVLVNANGSMVVERDRWAAVRPKAGTRVVIRVVPGGSNIWRSILMVVVAIAAVALGQLWAIPVSNALSISVATATTLITLGVTAIGMLLINALIPIKGASAADDSKEYGGYSVSGWRNSSNPDGPVPAPMGKMRFAPYYGAQPYTEIVGDVQYMRAIFVWGYGPAALSDFKFGDTSIDEYDEVEIEHRYGYATDQQLTLYTQQVIEEGLSVDLTRAWERNDDGSYKDGGHTIEKPEVRYTATSVTEAAIIVGLPGGVFSMNDDGNRQNFQVDIRIRQRPLAGGDWQYVTTLAIVAAKSTPFWRQYRWTLPSRGTWQIELTRMTDETKSSRVADRAVWQALQSFRPEYPLAFDRPLVLTAIRIRATYQLNGQIDNFSGVFSRIAPDWDAATSTWITRETRSPVAAFRWMLQGPAAAYPVADSAVDLDLLADWSQWCATKGLCYDRIHDQEESLADALSAAAHAGRAQPRHDGRHWSVVVDRPADLVVDHISPRNSRDFQWTRIYPRRPDGFRVKFPDATNDWKTSERIVPWPGLVGDVDVTEQLELPGKTDPDEIWIEARRRQYETDLRPDTFRVTQDGATRVATRGDLVAVSHDVLSRSQVAGRVKHVDGALVVLDEFVEMTAGVDYAMRFRVFADSDDTIGVSVVRALATVGGASKALRVAGAGSAMPAVGDLVHVGPRATESLLAFIRAEERGEDGAVIYHMVAAAPEIDTLTDAEVAPAWDGRAGATYTGGGATPAPAAPTVTAVMTGVAGTGLANGLAIHLEPGIGSVAVVTRFQIQHRPAGSAIWTTVTVSAASGGCSIAGYAAGVIVEIRARAVSLYDVAGPNTPVISVTIGSADVALPDPTSLSVLRLATGARRYSIVVDTTGIVGYRLRARPGTGWSWSELSPLHLGYLTSSPWESVDPPVAATYTIGAVAVDASGNESAHPLLISAALATSVASGSLSERLESALGWPGTITGAAISGGALVGAGVSLSYSSPIIDLGADKAVTVRAMAFGVVGNASLQMRTGLSSGGGTVGSAVPLGAVTARYVQIVAAVTGAPTNAHLGDITTLVSTA